MKHLTLFAVLALLIVMGCPAAPGDNTSGGSRGGTETANGAAASPQGAVEAVHGGVLHLPLEIAVDDQAVTNLDFTVPQLWALARCLEAPAAILKDENIDLPGLSRVSQSSGGGKQYTFKVFDAPGHPDEPGYVAPLLIEKWKLLLQGEKTPLREQFADLIAGAADYRDGRALDISGISQDGIFLTFELTRQDFSFPTWLTQPGLGLMLSRELPAGGYGPFLLTAIEGNELVLTPNPDSISGPPLLDELRFVCEPDRDRQLELYRSGKLDSANVTARMVSALEEDAALAAQMIRHETATPLLGIFNYSRFPWNDGEFQSRVGLRQALNWGINLETLAEMHSWQFEPWPHFLPPAFKQYIDPASIQQPVYPLSAEIEKARAGLILADHDQGIRLPTGMDCAFIPEDGVGDMVSDVLEFWNEVSVKMAPFGEPRKTLFERIDRERHEIILRPVHPGYPGPDALFYPLLHSSLTGLGGNWSILKDREIDAALEKWALEADPVTKNLLYQKLGIKLEERALFVFVGYATPHMLINPQLGGIELTPYDFDASLSAQSFSKLGFTAKE